MGDEASNGTAAALSLKSPALNQPSAEITPLKMRARSASSNYPASSEATPLPARAFERNAEGKGAAWPGETSSTAVSAGSEKGTASGRSDDDSSTRRRGQDKKKRVRRRYSDILQEKADYLACPVETSNKVYCGKVFCGKGAIGNIRRHIKKDHGLEHAKVTRADCRPRKPLQEDSQEKIKEASLSSKRQWKELAASYYSESAPIDPLTEKKEMVEGSKSESGKRKQPIDGDTLTAKRRRSVSDGGLEQSGGARHRSNTADSGQSSSVKIPFDATRTSPLPASMPLPTFVPRPGGMIGPLPFPFSPEKFSAALSASASPSTSPSLAPSMSPGMRPLPLTPQLAMMSLAAAQLRLQQRQQQLKEESGEKEEAKSEQSVKKGGEANLTAFPLFTRSPEMKPTSSRGTPTLSPLLFPFFSNMSSVQPRCSSAPHSGATGDNDKEGQEGSARTRRVIPFPFLPSPALAPGVAQQPGSLLPLQPLTKTAAENTPFSSLTQDRTKLEDDIPNLA